MTSPVLVRVIENANGIDKVQNTLWVLTLVSHVKIGNLLSFRMI